MTKNEALGEVFGVDNKIVMGVAAGALVMWGLRRGGVLGWAAAGVGGYLGYKTLTGQDPVMEVAGFNTVSKPIFIEHSIVIERPAAEVYAYWRELKNLPHIMSHLESVTPLDDKRSRWVAKAPVGTAIEWEAEIVNEKQGERIGWHSLPGAVVDNAGSVQFEALDERKTRVHVALSYRPPVGPLGTAVAQLFGEEPSQHIAEDLQRFKALLEKPQLPDTQFPGAQF